MRTATHAGVLIVYFNKTSHPTQFAMHVKKAVILLEPIAANTLLVHTYHQKIRKLSVKEYYSGGSEKSEIGDES